MLTFVSPRNPAFAGLLRSVFWFLFILENYAGSLRVWLIVIVTISPSRSAARELFHNFFCFPLCCLLFLSSHCSVFKVQLASSSRMQSLLEPFPPGIRISILSSLNTEIHIPLYEAFLRCLLKAQA
jgi:hypothetical protein